MGRRHAISGFTLVELLVVLVIMSLLLSLVPPLLSNVMPSVTIKATANDLLQDIKYVRNMAILRGRQTQIALNPVDGSYASSVKDNGSLVKLPADIRLDLKISQLQDSGEETQTINFFADGSSNGGIVILRTNDQAFSVVVDWLTGKVSLVEGLYDERV